MESAENLSMTAPFCVLKLKKKIINHFIFLFSKLLIEYSINYYIPTLITFNTSIVS